MRLTARMERPTTSGNQAACRTYESDERKGKEVTEGNLGFLLFVGRRGPSRRQAAPLTHAADLAQRFEDELVERNLRRGAQIIDAQVRASRFDIAKIARELLSKALR